MTTLTHGSLFTGAGMLDLAISEVFGARTVWVSDIDKGACKVLAHRYPHAPNLGDITAIDWATVEPVDIITGGYPCQPFSQAGRRLGQEDERHLWPYVRDAIAVLRPPMAVFENVRGHLTLGFDDVVRDLHQLGYDVEWVLIKASDLGACHQRDRLFILGVNRERRVRTPTLPDAMPLAVYRWGEWWEEDEGLFGPIPFAGPIPSSGRMIAGHLFAAPEPTFPEPATLLPTPTASNPNAEEDLDTWRARRERVKESASNGNGFGMPLGIAVRMLPTPGANLGGNGGPQDPSKRRAGGHQVSLEDAVHGMRLLPPPRQNQAAGVEPLGCGCEEWGHYAPAIHSHELLVGRAAPEPTEVGPSGKRRLSARAVEFMMCVPDGWVTDVPDITRNEALKALGNGVVVPQCVAALRIMLGRTIK